VGWLLIALGLYLLRSLFLEGRGALCMIATDDSELEDVSE